MAEINKDGRYLGETEDIDDFEKKDSIIGSHGEIRVNDPITSLTLEYKGFTTDEERTNFIRGLELTLLIPDVSLQTKDDIKAFLKKVKEETIEN